MYSKCVSVSLSLNINRPAVNAREEWVPPYNDVHLIKRTHLVKLRPPVAALCLV